MNSPKKYPAAFFTKKEAYAPKAVCQFITKSKGPDFQSKPKQTVSHLPGRTSPKIKTKKLSKTSHRTQSAHQKRYFPAEEILKYTQTTNYSNYGKALKKYTKANHEISKRPSFIQTDTGKSAPPKADFYKHSMEKNSFSNCSCFKICACQKEHGCAFLFSAARLSSDIAAALDTESKKLLKAARGSDSAEALLTADDSVLAALEYAALLEQLLLQRWKIRLHKKSASRT